MNAGPRNTLNLKQVVLILVLLTGFSSCKDLTEIKATGIVRDASNQQPLDSARVSLYEDNDGPFMGSHLLQETTTDASGKFTFHFDYKEGPYKIFVTRPGYHYSRIVKDKIFNQEHLFEYQEVEALKEEQHLIFDLDPQAYLILKIKNTAPAQASDQVRVEIDNATARFPAFSRTLDGIVETELPVGNIPANKFTRIIYTVRENNTWRAVADSVSGLPRKSVIYNLNY